MQNLRTKVIRSVFALGSASAFSQAITWMLTILIARLLDPADYGIVAMAAIYIGFAEYFNEFGIGAAIIQKKDLTDEEVRATYTASIAFGIFFTCFSFIVAHLLAAFFDEPRLVLIVYTLGFSFVISAAKNIQQNLMIRHMKFTHIARIEAISRISGASLTYACALKGFGVWSLVVQYLSYNLLQAILYFCHQRVFPGRISNFGQIKAILTFGFQVMLARIMYFFSGKTDTLVIGKIIGTKPLGFYSFALMLANKPIEKIMSIINQVLFPVFSKSQDDFDSVKRYALKTLEIQLFIMLPIFLFLFLGADVVVRLFLGERWLGIILPLKVFAIIGIFQYVRSLSSMLAVSLGRPKLDIYYNSAVLIVLTSAMIPLGYMYKLEGILLAWIIIYPIITLVYFIVLMKIIGITLKTVFDRIYLPIFITGAMSVSLFFYHRILPVTTWPEFCVMCIFSIMVYSLSLVLVDRSKAFEIVNLIRSVNVRPVDAKT